MGLIKNQLENLTEADLWSFSLFALFKLREDPAYAALSELAFILDKSSLIDLCEYFGGMTLKIPTIDELEIILYAITLYQEVDIKHKDFDKMFASITEHSVDSRKLKQAYLKIQELLATYQFTARGDSI